MFLVCFVLYGVVGACNTSIRRIYFKSAIWYACKKQGESHTNNQSWELLRPSDCLLLGDSNRLLSIVSFMGYWNLYWLSQRAYKGRNEKNIEKIFIFQTPYKKRRRDPRDTRESILLYLDVVMRCKICPDIFYAWKTCNISRSRCSAIFKQAVVNHSTFPTEGRNTHKQKAI